MLLQGRRSVKIKSVKQITSLSVIFTSLITTGCTKDQVMRLTYETLRQEDCHRNSFRTDYCDRGYGFEYSEYKELRNNYFQQIDNREIALTTQTATSN